MMKNSKLASLLGGVLQGADADFSRIVIDSRIVQPGDCFIAIKGDLFDGHDFVAEVAEKGATVIIIDQPVTLSIPTLVVNNTKQALSTLASYFRASTSIPVVGITGSCGKTTTRVLIETILKSCGHVLASQKSFNNDIGLPLTLFQLTADHDYAVLEIGTNHPGEIAALTAIAKPTVAVVTMVAGVHVEGFGSVEKIANEKSDIYQTADIGIVNNDDRFVALFKDRLVNKKIITFGVTHEADVMAKEIVTDANGFVRFVLVDGLNKQQAVVNLPMLGVHNVTNALAAAAIAVSLSISFEKIVAGLESAVPEYGRLNIKTGLKNSIVIDDSYNANPTSVCAAIDILTSRTQNSALVFGDMKELGDGADEAHVSIGHYAREKGVKTLFCYGDKAMLTAQAFGKNAMHFNEQAALIEALCLQLSDKMTVLVKGSNSMKMTNIVKAISE